MTDIVINLLTNAATVPISFSAFIPDPLAPGAAGEIWMVAYPFGFIALAALFCR